MRCRSSRDTQELFRIAAEEGRDEPGRPWSFNVAMLEIYNEAVFDLLGLAASPTAAGSSHSVSGSLDVSGLPAGELPAHVDRCVLAGRTHLDQPGGARVNQPVTHGRHDTCCCCNITQGAGPGVAACQLHSRRARCAQGGLACARNCRDGAQRRQQPQPRRAVCQGPGRA
jgi:hypothetical protein